MKEHLKNFALLTVSTLIMAVGIYFFKFANNFTFGGITGFAVLVAKFTPLSASDFSFIVEYAPSDHRTFSFSGKNSLHRQHIAVSYFLLLCPDWNVFIQ